jgi:radical SAM protein with 4Fe4S-binding SPASM domain
VTCAREIGLPVQINTTITRYNLADFDDLAAKMIDLGIVLWSVFFLVPTGRGREQDEVTAAQYEWVFERLHELSRRAPFDIKTTEAPHYRRFLMQRAREERRRARSEGSAFLPASFAKPGGPGFSAGDGVGRAAKGVNDGRGFVFVSHTGEIYPSGFLPLSAGNVRAHSLVDIYRNSSLFREIRNYDLLKGKCGLCEYKTVCGGSRSRAYALTGDYMESDPYCVYVPRGAEQYAGIVR